MNTELLKAYQDSKYVVPELGLTILLNEKESKQIPLLAESNDSTFCFITAFNPYSQSLSAKENSEKNIQLVQELVGYTYFHGYGQDKEEKWQAEDSFFVLGITKEIAMQLGNKYQQNAILFGEIIDGCVKAELIVLV